MRCLLAIFALAISAAGHAQITDIAGCGGVDCTRQSLRVPLNGVVRFTLPSGQVALIQFVSFHESSADYRWKYRPAAKAAVTQGSGTVVEKYESFPARSGNGNQVLPLPGHDLIIRAGDLRAEWSLGGDKYGYVYFNPKFARGELLESPAFANDP
jgi:hypothetical protein